MSNDVKKGSFVVLSDFHGYDWPFDKIVNYYLSEYDTIYILGDATDRGPYGDGSGGIELLFKIKDLANQYPGRVVYVPGNHDKFLYDYAAHNDSLAYNCLMRNGGAGTIRDYINFKESSVESELNELIEWLGDLPLQRVHEYNDKKYVMAHALFNQRLYDSIPDFSLKKMYKCMETEDKNVSDYLLNVIWYRKGEYYSKKDLPSADSIMVIGHTPLKYREDDNLDLVNENGDVVKVFCVDGGIAYDGRMLKYDGGNSPLRTNINFHNNTSNNNNTTSSKSDVDESFEELDLMFENEETFKKLIIDIFKNSSDNFAIYSKLSGLYYGINIWELTDDQELRKNVRSISSEGINDILKHYAIQRDGVYNSENKSLIYDYVSEVIFDYIFESLIERFGSKKTAINQINGLFQENNFEYITSMNDARKIGKFVGVDSLKAVVKKRGFKSVYDYVDDKFGFDNTI